MRAQLPSLGPVIIKNKVHNTTECLICGKVYKTCVHLVWSKLGELLYGGTLWTSSSEWAGFFSKLAAKDIIQAEIRIGHSDGRYLMSLTTPGRYYVLDNISKVIKELADIISDGFDQLPTDLCEYYMHEYITLEQLPQFITSDNPFIRKIAQKHFQLLSES